MVKQTVSKLLGIKAWDKTSFRKLRRIYYVLTRDVPSYPKYVTLELTTNCNSRCRYCAREAMLKLGKLTAKNMEFNLLTEIIRQLKLNGNVKHFSIAGTGEPLLYPQFSSAIGLIRNNLPNVEIDVITNGILLNKQSESIVENATSLTVSLNTYDKNTYFKLNGVDAFDLVVENVEDFLRLKDRPPVRIQMFIIDANDGMYNSFVRSWKHLLREQDAINFKVFENMSGWINKSGFVKNEMAVERYPCLQLWTRLSFSVEGDVYPCCLASIACKGDILLGNIQNDSLNTIINNGTLSRLRMQHRNGRFNEIETCRKCDVWKVAPNVFVKFRKRWN